MIGYNVSSMGSLTRRIYNWWGPEVLVAADLRVRLLTQSQRIEADDGVGGLRIDKTGDQQG